MSITFTATPADENGLVFHVDIFENGALRSRHICATRMGEADLANMVQDIINPPPAEPEE